MLCEDPVLQTRLNTRKGGRIEEKRMTNKIDVHSYSGNGCTVGKFEGPG